MGRVHEFGIGKQKLDLGIRQDIGDFTRGQPPSDRHHHRPHPRRRDIEQEVGIAVLAQPRDPITLGNIARLQQRDQLPCQPVSLGI